MEARPPLVYFVLGTPGSGRRAIVADLVANGLGPMDSALLLTPGIAEESNGLAAAAWTWDAGAIAALIPAGTTHVFMLADPTLNPVDQVEALVAWLPATGAKIGRVFTVVDCTFGHSHPGLFGWFEACVHFSDVVLFTNTAGVPASWTADFEKHFRKLFFPCLFERPSKGEVSNPALVLETLALRMTPVFEDEFTLAGSDVDYEIEGDDDDDEADDVDAIEEPLEDPYFVRNGGGGNRTISVPDIGPFLRPSG